MSAAPNGDGLPLFELAFPGPLRDRLVAAVLDGSKTTTTGLLADYERERELLPQAGTARHGASTAAN